MLSIPRYFFPLVIWLAFAGSSSTFGILVAEQDFDSNTSWGFSSDVAFFDNGTDGFYGETDNSRAGFNLTTLTDEFLGVRDLDDEGDNGASMATVTFANVNTAGLSNIVMSFDWQVAGFDTGDSFDYEFFADGVSLGNNTAIGNSSGFSSSGTISSPVIASASNVSMFLKITQNGSDFGGWDNFQVNAVPEPSQYALFGLFGLLIGGVKFFSNKE